MERSAGAEVFAAPAASLLGEKPAAHGAPGQEQPTPQLPTKSVKARFWLLSLAAVLLICCASPLFFAPLWQPAMPARASGEAPPDLAAAMRVDLNTASLEQLCTLPNVGEARAGAILAYREAHGGFASLEEVCEVKGIGEKTLQSWDGLAYVSSGE